LFCEDNFRLADNGNDMMKPSRVLPFSSAKPPAAALRCGAEPFSLSGPSPAIAKLWSQVRRVAPYFRTALLTGEPGAGAEVVARALYEQSPFRGRPLCVLSGSAAEVYFADGRAPSRERQHGGYFLEEVERLSQVAQYGLLQLVRLRGTRAVCVMGFARYDLRALVGGGRFLSELANSLGGLRIALPSLRERREDIPMLLQEFVSRAAVKAGRDEPQIGEDFVEAACEYAWPRNLDQMGEITQWLVGRQSGETLGREDFEVAYAACRPGRDGETAPVRLIRLEEMVQEHIRGVLVACKGNKLKAAEVLGISRSTLYRMLDTAVSAPALRRTG
jgi:DNA-binding NtrC family response regulator